MSSDSPASRRCPSCAADVPRPEARFCEHCGAALAAPAVPAPPSDPLGDVPARFRALEQHPDLGALLGATPAIPELAGKLLPSALLLAALAAVGLLLSLYVFAFCPPLGFLPLALVVFFVYAISKRLAGNARAPLVARPALVVGLRAKLMVGAEHSPSHTQHLATLQFADGTRAEHECYASAAGALTPGDLGVAYLKGAHLASFARVAV